MQLRKMSLALRIRRKIISILSTVINRLKFLVMGVDCGKGFVSCGIIKLFNYSGRSSIIIGENVTINSSVISNPVCGTETVLYTYNDGRIQIGNNVGISNATICSVDSIVIGDYAIIGGGVRIYDTDFHALDYNERYKKNNRGKKEKVIIGPKSFIGSNVIILKGVSIGEGSVVGAGSVVTHSIPSYELWAGNPARFIKTI
jgi:acetyltransferase-like isoleucine patch superfamily enzyme